MRKALLWTLPVALSLLAGCVVVPARGYVAGPRVAIVAPGPVFYAHGYYHSRW